MSAFAIFCKALLIMIIGIPFFVVELLGVIFALCSCLPVIGVILNFTLCLMCDLLASGLFYLLMLPNLSSIKRKKMNAPASKNTDNNILLKKIHLTMDTKDALLPLLNCVSNSFLGEDGIKIRKFVTLCMMTDELYYQTILNFILFLQCLDDASPEFAKMEEMKEAISLLKDLLKTVE